MVTSSPGRAAALDTDTVLVVAKQRRRLALGSAAVLLLLYLGYIALTTSTTMLSGRLGGLGTAYWVGFAIFGLVLVVAHGYARWARRMDDLAAATRDGGREQ